MGNIDDGLRQLLGVRIELDGVEYPNHYNEDLDIDPTNLEEEFLTHSKRYAYYATLAEMAEDRHQRSKEELDRLFADLDHEVREKRDVIMAQNPKFKMTEPMIKNEILSDARYQKKLSEVQTARYLSKVLKNANTAFSHRKDMLMTLGRTSMATITDPRISGGQQQQVRNMFAAKSAPRLPPPVVEQPDDLEAGLIAPEGEEIEFNPPVDDSPAPTRRRTPTPKTA